MRCNIIGAGRLGKNIAWTLFAQKICSSISICNSSLESAQKACHELGFGLAVEAFGQLPEADITWILCNDDAIPKVVEGLTGSKRIRSGSFVIHCSGVLNSHLLNPLKAQDCLIASFHPLKAFSTNYLVPNAFKQVDCVLEGDDEVCDWLKRTFTDLEANLITIQPEAKSAYHAAACMASNYLITLAYCSEQLFLQAGIEAQHIRPMILNLMQSNLHNLKQAKTTESALTGPLARGDSKTISLHLKAINNQDIKQLYQSAAVTTLNLTQLPEAIKRHMMQIVKELP